MTPFDRLFRCMTKPWVVLSYVALMVLSFMYLDKPITIFFHDLKVNHLPVVMASISNLGHRNILLAVLLFFALLFRFIIRRPTAEKQSWFLVLATVIPGAINLVLKIAFGRARPPLLFQEDLYGFQWMKFTNMYWSFPSGHTATIMGFAFGVWAVLPRYRWAALTLGLLVMLSRIILLRHYFSDVMTSAYLAMLEVWLLQWVYRRYAPAFMKEVQH